MLRSATMALTSRCCLAVQEMDLDGSGEISRDEMHEALSVFGLDLDKGDVAKIIAQIDIDNSGGIDVHEFVAWMEVLYNNVAEFRQTCPA